MVQKGVDGDWHCDGCEATRQSSEVIPSRFMIIITMIIITMIIITMIIITMIIITIITIDNKILCIITIITTLLILNIERLPRQRFDWGKLSPAGQAISNRLRCVFVSIWSESLLSITFD